MRIFRLLAACIALCALSSAALAQSRARPVEVDRIVAVVNDDAITLHELEARLATAERQLRAQGTQLPPRETLMRQLLERLIVDRVQIQYARETGLQVPDGELDAALRRIAENNRLTLPAFKAALERDGVAWNKFREEIRG
ncbi:MAG: SurA N-terminal domain-containing protein, partial [Ignavibacteria bacterium]